MLFAFTLYLLFSVVYRVKLSDVVKLLKELLSYCNENYSTVAYRKFRKAFLADNFELHVYLLYSINT